MLSSLYLLRFNNYKNRIIKYKEKLRDYEEYVLGAFSNINFIPNDGINTTQIINWDGDIPDYILVCETGREFYDTKILSRWFVIDSTRKLNGQFELNLFRDTLADYYLYLQDAIVFMEKGPLSNSDPMIFNEENITLNQIKESETLLTDKSRIPWIIGYLPSNNPKDENNQDIPYKFKFKRRPQADFEVETLDLFKQTYIDEGSNRFVKSFKYKVIGSETTLLTGTRGAYMLYNASSAEYVATRDEEGLPSYISVKFNLKNSEDISEARKLAMMHAKGAYSISTSDMDYYAGYEGDTAFTKALDYEGKVIYVSSTGQYYKINCNTILNQEFLYNVAVGTEVYQKMDNYLLSLRSANFASGEADGNTYKIIMNVWDAEISFEQFKNPTIDKEIEIPITRNLLQDAPYSMFAIPFGKAYFDEDGIIKYHQTNKDAIIDYICSMSRDLSGANILIDIQLLPYCPVLKVGDNWDPSLGYGMSIDSMAPNYDFTYTTIYEREPSPNLSGYSEGIFTFWCKKSTFSLDILSDGGPYIANPYDMNNMLYDAQYPWTNKLWNETKKYRLCSPNYASIFDFSPAKNGGVQGFNVDCTYRPFQPYIKIAPIFGGLYGKDFNDARGLICGGDFSLPQLNDAWATYQRQNTNYEKSFQRGIESMELSNKWGRVSDITTAITGSIGAGTTGAMTGMMTGANPIGTAAIAGGASLIGGGIDAGVNEILRNEAINLKKDQFGYQLGNIQALPNTISKLSAFTANNKIFPVLECYGCTREETEAFINKLVYNGLTVMRIGRLGEFITNKESSDIYIPDGYNYFKGRIIRINMDDDYHHSAVMSEELDKGVFI